MKKRLNKQGQIKMSFNMIFSLIMIIIFVAFAFYVIAKLVNPGGLDYSIKVGKFFDDVQKDVDEIWKSRQASKEITYSLPEEIELICFIDYSGNNRGNIDIWEDLERYSGDNRNIFLYSEEEIGELRSTEIKHIDLEKITEEKNPKCFKNEGGKVSMIIKKDFGNNLAYIE